MSSLAGKAPTQPAPAALETRQWKLRWWREVAYILAFYGVYTAIRNLGVATDASDEAFRNALTIIRIERLLGAYVEEPLQDLFHPGRIGLLKVCNIFYGTAHFLVTAGALVHLFRTRSPRYRLWRNTLACTTALALVGYALFPLMPPRLLPPEHGYVDTLRVVGGLWSFESGPVQRVSNQYAAMPSLHFAWSAWCTLVLLTRVRRSWLRALVVAYPVLTLFAIVVTANHYWLDAVGGAVVLAAGLLAARTVTFRASGGSESAAADAPPGDRGHPG